MAPFNAAQWGKGEGMRNILILIANFELQVAELETLQGGGYPPPKCL